MKYIVIISIILFILLVLGLTIYIVRKHDSLSNCTQMYDLVNAINKGNLLSGYSKALYASGVYLENKSTRFIRNVNLTINNSRGGVAVWVYTVNKPGGSSSPWQSLYQTIPIPQGGYTDTYDIPCNFPPGAGFIVNAVQTGDAEVIFNSVKFS